ncbi:MAG: response regulator, partial [Clostridiales bacterium]|nr:response regulator [Clostridiales bacterium]
TIGKAAPSAEKKDYALGKIEDASAHLLGVINDILDMSKIEADKLELSPDAFDFERMLQKVVNVINFRIGEKQQELIVNIDGTIPRALIGDDQRLSQVITNLLSNAVKFTPQDGSIILGARLLGESGGSCEIQVDVSDTGIGISEEQQSRLFKSFVQAESSTSRKFGGTGLGLAISKRIVEMMDGRIWLKSEVGHGSTFSFTARLARASGTAEPESEKRRSALRADINRRNVRVLLADDAPEVREYFAEISRGLGVKCDVAASGEEALGLIGRRGGYDIYFIDWRMPGMDGLELARRISGRWGGGQTGSGQSCGAQGDGGGTQGDGNGLGGRLGGASRNDGNGYRIDDAEPNGGGQDIRARGDGGGAQAGSNRPVGNRPVGRLCGASRIDGNGDSDSRRNDCGRPNGLGQIGGGHRSDGDGCRIDGAEPNVGGLGGRPEIVLISSAEWNGIEDEARLAGVDRFLQKPLFPSSIADCVSEYLGIGGLLDEAGAARGQQGEADDFSGRHMLLAEDVEINREIVQTLLEPTFLEIHCAENGDAALQMFRDNPGLYSIILMDVQMPVMDGFEATRQIRALDAPGAKEIPIIAMTANVFRTDIDACLEAGMNDHLGKPLDVDDMMEKLRQYMPARQPAGGSRR